MADINRNARPTSSECAVIGGYFGDPEGPEPPKEEWYEALGTCRPRRLYRGHWPPAGAAAVAIELLMMAGEPPGLAAQEVARAIKRRTLPGVTWSTVSRWRRELAQAATFTGNWSVATCVFARQHFAIPLARMRERVAAGEDPRALAWECIAGALPDTR